MSKAAQKLKAEAYSWYVEVLNLRRTQHIVKIATQALKLSVFSGYANTLKNTPNRL